MTVCIRYQSEKALEELKNKKATGPDGIPAELLKALGSAGKREQFEICNEIYICKEWPEDFLESIIIPIVISLSVTDSCWLQSFVCSRQVTN